MQSFPVQFGIDTFGDVTALPTGGLTPQAQVIREVVDEAVVAEEAGLDFFGVGEHHRVDFAVSSPEMVLAAAAARTSRIRLGSAVTVLSSDEPIRVFQRFSTLDALSDGRAEVILGRGSFTESFPLFGLDLERYEELFEEKLDLFAALVSEEEVTWKGELRPPLVRTTVYPRPASPLTTWVGEWLIVRHVCISCDFDFGASRLGPPAHANHPRLPNASFHFPSLGSEAQKPCACIAAGGR